MTRRDAILSTLAMIPGGQELRTSTLGAEAAGTLTVYFVGPHGVKAVIVSGPNGQRVEITHEEVFDALTHEHRPLTGMKTGIDFNGRLLWVCADCGQTYWPGQEGR